MRVLVAGSRTWTNDAAIRQALRYATEGHAFDYVTIVHGDCPTGADRIANHIADYWGIACERHPAAWQEYGKAAGFIRNAEMVAAGADVCLAFLMPCTKPSCPHPRPHPSHGATHCADLAEKAGIPTYRWTA